MFHGTQKGLFWLLNKPDHMVEGTLDVDYGGRLELTTHGLLDPSADESELRTIRGTTSSEHVALVDARISGGSHQFGRYLSESRQSWYCHYAFLGEHEIDLLDDRVASVEVKIQLLPAWANIGRDFQLNTDVHRGSLSWSVEPPIPSCRWSSGEVGIRQEVKLSYPGIERRYLSLQVMVETSFVVKFDEPQPRKVAQDVVSSLQALVTVAKGEAVAIEGVALAVDKGESDTWMTFHYQPILRPDRPAAKDSELFSLSELGGIGGVGKWLNVLCNQTLLKNALLVDRYQKPAFVTDWTGHLLMACEVYRRHATNQKTEKMDLDTVLGPEPDHLGTEFLDWIGDWKDWKDKVGRIRHEQIAHLQNYENTAGGGTSIHVVNKQLYTLIVARILSDCGFSGDLIGRVVDRSRSDAVVRLPTVAFPAIKSGG